MLGVQNDMLKVITLNETRVGWKEMKKMSNKLIKFELISISKNRERIKLSYLVKKATVKKKIFHENRTHT